MASLELLKIMTTPGGKISKEMDGRRDELSTYLCDFFDKQGLSFSEFWMDNIRSYHSKLSNSNTNGDLSPDDISTLTCLSALLDIENHQTSTPIQKRVIKVYADMKVDISNSKDKLKIPKDLAVLLGAEAYLDNRERLKNEDDTDYTTIMNRIQLNDIKNSIETFCDNNNGQITRLEIIDCLIELSRQKLPDNKTDRLARNTNYEFIKGIKAHSNFDIMNNKKDLASKDHSLAMFDLDKVLIGTTSSNDSTQRSSKEDQKVFSNLMANGLNCIVPHSSMSREEIEDTYEYFLNLCNAGYEQELLNTLGEEIQESADYFSGNTTELNNVKISLLLTANYSENRLKIDRKQNDFLTGRVSASEYVEKLKKMPTDELMTQFPKMFESRSKNQTEEDIAGAIRLNAEVMSDLFSKNKRIAENVMQMLYGNDKFYNLEAGVAIATLKLASIIGLQVDDQIEEIDLTAAIANEHYGDELNKWAGNFIRKHVVDVASIVSSFVLTGGVGTVASLTFKALGYAGDIHELKTEYDQLMKDPNFKDNPEKVIWELTKSIGIKVGTQAIGWAYNEQFKKSFEYYHINPNVASGASSFATFGVTKLATHVENFATGKKPPITETEKDFNKYNYNYEQ